MSYREQVRERYSADFRQYVEKKGGIMLSCYINSSTNVLIKCEKGHEWEATPDNIKHGGSWCPYCARRAPHTLDSCRQTANERGGWCLATEYTNSLTNMRWRCKKGHEWEATYNSIKNNGSWCPYCATNAPLTLNIFQQIAIERGGECTSSEYNRMRMGFRCRKGHEWEAVPGHIKNSGSWCPFCHNKSENAVRVMLKYALGLDFPPYSRKALERLGIELRNTAGNLMHLDGFNFDIYAAFEYHGCQHTDGGSHIYEYATDSFESRRKDDELKREQCEEFGIVLFEVYQELHGVWPHLNMLYTGLLDVLEGSGLSVVDKPNQSDVGWIELITSDVCQTNLDDFFAKT
jgi:hypothetical protein